MFPSCIPQGQSLAHFLGCAERRIEKQELKCSSKMQDLTAHHFSWLASSQNVKAAGASVIRRLLYVLLCPRS
jgi:hypothetical protein